MFANVMGDKIFSYQNCELALEMNTAIAGYVVKFQLLSYVGS